MVRGKLLQVFDRRRFFLLFLVFRDLFSLFRTDLDSFIEHFSKAFVQRSSRAPLWNLDQRVLKWAGMALIQTFLTSSNGCSGDSFLRAWRSSLKCLLNCNTVWVLGFQRQV